jgi:AraC family transcriptional activator of pyochelin receptor
MTVVFKQRIDVSPEMLSFVGAGAIEPDAGIAHSITLSFRLGDGDRPATIASGDTSESDAAVVLAVATSACERIFGFLPDADAVWHMPTELRSLVVALRDCPLAEPVRTTLRLAKSIELLCASYACLHDGALIPADGAGDLSALDAGRLAAARRLIDDRWQEKLTLDAVARACGLNRAKLTRGFRQMFGSTVADAIADKRLSGAHGLLLATDLPVSAIGYRCGYRNNASFTRAFARRFGVPPTRLRAIQAAA